jgi:hypothetical protein
MKLDCPQCRANLDVADRLAGKTGRCPQCRQPIQIPEIQNPMPSPGTDPQGRVSFAERVRRLAGALRRGAAPAVQHLRKLAERAVGEAKEIVRFYRAQRVTLWNWLIVTMGWDNVRESFSRTLVFSQSEFVEDIWELPLPDCCVVCGEATGEEGTQRRGVELDDVCMTGWVLVGTVGAVPFVAWFFGWIGLFILLLAGLAVGVRVCSRRPVSVSYSVCARHRNNKRYPELHIVNSGLMVQFGSSTARSRIRQARRELQDTGRSPRSRFHPPAPRPAETGSVPEAEASPLPKTIALAETVEPSPIIHAPPTMSTPLPGAKLPQQPLAERTAADEPRHDFIRITDESPEDSESRDTATARLRGPQALSPPDSGDAASRAAPEDESRDNPPTGDPIQLSDDAGDDAPETDGLLLYPTAAAHSRRPDESKPPPPETPGRPDDGPIYLVDDAAEDDETGSSWSTGGNAASDAGPIGLADDYRAELPRPASRHADPATATPLLQDADGSDGIQAAAPSGDSTAGGRRTMIAKSARLGLRIAVKAAMLAALMVTVLAGYGYRTGVSPDRPVERQLNSWFPQAAEQTILPPGPEAAEFWMHWLSRHRGDVLPRGAAAAVAVVFATELLGGLTIVAFLLRVMRSTFVLVVLPLVILAALGWYRGLSAAGTIESSIARAIQLTATVPELPPGRDAATYWLRTCFNLPARTLAIGFGAALGIAIVFEWLRFSGRRGASRTD